MRNDAGGTLPATLWALAVGALVMAPFLGQLSTSLLAGREAQQGLLEQYSADASLEFAIWKLQHDQSYRDSVDVVPGTPITISPAATVNGITTSTTATAIPIGIWAPLANHPTNVGAGGSLVWGGGDYLYAFRGGNSNQFRRYSISGNSWSSMANAPANVTGGGALVYDGGNYIYAFRGGATAFWRYSISGNSWTTLATAPLSTGNGAALVHTGGNDVYATRGSNARQFWRYSISGNSWTSLADTPANVGAGGRLAYIGGDSIYGFRGGGNTAFWLYSISGDSWSSQASTLANVATGGSLAFYDGTDYLFAFRGGTTTVVWRYEVSRNRWIPVATAPATVAAGGSLAYAGGNTIYALRGHSDPDFWRFTITPPEFDLTSTAGGTTIDARIRITGSTVNVLIWDVN
jgi:outer membrane protein assembly factor BamB